MEQKLFDAAARLPEASLAFEDIENSPKVARTRKIPRVFWTAAACLVLVLTIGFGSFAIAAEAQEYQDALAFFDEYGLSTEGLTREEIKAVYRDITEDIFANPKTAEVITKRMPVNWTDIDKVGGYEIVQDAPTPEEIENLWHSLNGGWSPTPENGIHYAYSSEYDEDKNGYLTLTRNYVEMYDGELLIWKILISDKFQIDNVFPLSDGVIVAGTEGSYLNAKAWITKLDTSGQVVFSQPMHQELIYNIKSEVICNILGNDDGSFTVFSKYNNNIMHVSKYTADGQVIKSNGSIIADYRIGVVTKWGDGFAVQLISSSWEEPNKVVRVNENCMACQTFTYDNEAVDYYITDMLVVNDKLYLSSYAVPKAKDEGGRHEIASILDYLQENKILSIGSAELTPIVRENYTAMLLVCDAESGIPQQFYSVKGSMGGRLTYTSAGTLLWDVESIASTFFSPATSSFTIGGSCIIYRYAFIGNKVIEQKTGETTAYRR